MTLALVLVSFLLAVTAALLIRAGARLDSMELERQMLLQELRAFRTLYAKKVDAHAGRQ